VAHEDNAAINDRWRDLACGGHWVEVHSQRPHLKADDKWKVIPHIAGPIGMPNTSPHRLPTGFEILTRRNLRTTLLQTKPENGEPEFCRVEFPVGLASHHPETRLFEVDFLSL
jgi:hypothetical protein